MKIRPNAIAMLFVSLLGSHHLLAADAPETGPGASCIDAVRGKIQCSNPDEVCPLLCDASQPSRLRELAGASYQERWPRGPIVAVGPVVSQRNA
jgi:hypothetical protein